MERVGGTHTNNLYLDIDLDELLGQGIYLIEPRVHSASEAAKFGNQANIALGYGLVWVRTDDAAGDGSECPDDGASSVDHGTVPAVGVLTLVALDNAGI
jgi:hypothetical protein